MNPARFEAFSEAYVAAVLASVEELRLDLAGKPVGVYALDSTLVMIGMIQEKGLQSVEHYVLNRRAFPRTANALGVEPTTNALQAYFDGA